MNETNPAKDLLDQVRSSSLLAQLIEWLREPPGLYLAIGGAGFFIFLVIRSLLSGSATGQRKAAEKQRTKLLLAELKAHKEEGNWRGVGDIYERLGDKAAALKAYRKGRLGREEGLLLLQMGDRSAAKKAFEQGSVWDMLAKTCNEDGELSRAAEAYEKAGKWLDAAEAWEHAKDPRKAAALYKKAGMSSKAAELFAQQGGRQAAEVLDKEVRMGALREKGAAMADALVAKLKRAVELWAKEGEFEKAFRLAVDCEQWKLAVPLAVENLPPTPETADVCVSAGALVEAAGLYEKIGDKRQAALLRAQHHHRRGERIDAARYFEQAEEWVQAGDLYYNLGDIAKAAACYEKGEDLRPAAEMYAAAGEFQKAAAIYSKLGEHKLAAEAFSKSGDAGQQVEMLRASGEHLAAGKLLLERRMNEKAIECFQQVRPDSPDYAESRMLLGEIFLEKNDRAAARASFQKACEGKQVGPDSVRAFYGLARVEEAEGNHKEARRLYEQINAEQYGFKDVAIRLKGIQDGRPLSGTMAGKKITPSTGVPPSAAESDQYGRTISSEAILGASSAGPEITKAPINTPSGRYTLDGELGRGGMGVVYKAMDNTLKRPVAYKALPDDLREHPKAAENLLVEARSAAQLSHPNIVQVYDAGKDERGYFVVMEFIEGKTLDKVLKESRLSVPGVLNVARQILAALSHAHSRRVVHRDLKPANLFWTKDKLVKLMDFGLARVYNESVGNIKTRIAGTPYYMAPEQIRGEAVGPRTDIYSFGCVLYELLCNRPPFTWGELAYHHVHTPVEDPRKHREDIPEALARVCLKCLEKKPEDRYGSAEEVVKALVGIK